MYVKPSEETRAKALMKCLHSLMHYTTSYRILQLQKVEKGYNLWNNAPDFISFGRLLSVTKKKDSIQESFFCSHIQAFLFCIARMTSRVAAIRTRETGSTIQTFWTKPAMM